MSAKKKLIEPASLTLKNLSKTQVKREPVFKNISSPSGRKKKKNSEQFRVLRTGNFCEPEINEGCALDLFEQSTYASRSDQSENMNSQTNNTMLQFLPDSVEMARKDVGLDKPGSVEQAVQILEAWLLKQDHFMKKDFDKKYLEATVIGAKGSVERAKHILDKICTLRSLLPQFFGNFNVKTDFGNLFDIVSSVVLPKMTAENYRTFWIKVYNMDYKQSQFLDFYRYNVIVGEYVKKHDYANGFRIVADFTESNVLDFVTSSGIVEMRQALTIYMEGYGMRVKGIHIITPSKLVDALVTILKQVLSPKIAGRLHIHKTVDEVFKFIPQEILPAEYGGKEKPLRKLQDEWLDVLTSEEHMNYLREMNKAVTDESYRQTDKFNENYAGMPGTFRLLSVD